MLKMTVFYVYDENTAVIAGLYFHRKNIILTLFSSLYVFFIVVQLIAKRKSL